MIGRFQSINNIFDWRKWERKGKRFNHHKAKLKSKRKGKYKKQEKIKMFILTLFSIFSIYNCSNLTDITNEEAMRDLIFKLQAYEGFGWNIGIDAKDERAFNELSKNLVDQFDKCNLIIGKLDCQNLINLRRSLKIITVGKSLSLETIPSDKTFINGIIKANELINECKTTKKEVNVDKRTSEAIEFYQKLKTSTLFREKNLIVIAIKIMNSNQLSKEDYMLMDLFSRMEPLWDNKNIKKIHGKELNLLASNSLQKDGTMTLSEETMKLWARRFIIIALPEILTKNLKTRQRIFDEYSQNPEKIHLKSLRKTFFSPVPSPNEADKEY